MKVMLDCSVEKIRTLSEKHDTEFWQLRTPLTRNRVSSIPYGLDNGCFSGQLPKGWQRLLYEAHDNRPVFVCAPDVVGSAIRTADLFDEFKEALAGLPIALVLQDGIESMRIPWGEIEAVFIGGSDAFKYSKGAIDAAKCAKILGKWVHVGRVNGTGRLKQWMGLADSIDGSGISRFDHMLDSIVHVLKNPELQGQLEV